MTVPPRLLALALALTVGAAACGGSTESAEPSAVSVDVADETTAEADSTDVEGDQTDAAADASADETSEPSDSDAAGAPYEQSVAAWDAAGYDIPECMADVVTLGFGTPGPLMDDEFLCSVLVIDYPGYDEPAPVYEVLLENLVANGATMGETTEWEIEGLPQIGAEGTSADGRRIILQVGLTDGGLPEPDLNGAIDVVAG